MGEGSEGKRTRKLRKGWYTHSEDGQQAEGLQHAADAEVEGGHYGGHDGRVREEVRLSEA